MTKDTLIRQAVRGALALGAAGSMVGAGAAMAQATNTNQNQGQTKLGKIEVVGTRIPRTSIATSQPVLNINRQQIEATGFTTVGQLLQNLSSAGAALNTNFNNGGTGQEFVDLHNVGSQRVLVLVNGHRWIPTLGGPVDLTTIPTAVVDHIEILLNGASAIYGSDAIGGVINIITIKNFNGAEASAYMGMYDAHNDGGGWDGKTQRYNFTVGTSNNNSGVLLSAGYYKADPVWAGSRTISKEPYIGTGQTFGSSGTPGGRFIVAATPGNGFSYPGCTTGYCDLAGPLTAPGGATPSGTAHPFTNADRYNYAPDNYLLTPQERWYTYTQGHYDLTPNVTFSFTTTYQRRNSKQILAPNPYFFGPYGGEMQNGMNIGVSKTNPYNPFGVDLAGSASGYTTTTTPNGVSHLRPTGPGKAWCSLYGSGGGTNGCSPNAGVLLLYGRRPLETGNRVFSQNVNTFYFNGGFNGYFEALGNEWNWNAFYTYGQSLETDITTGLANTARIQKALGPVSQCTGSCVPLNLFGGDVNGHPTMTPAMVNYILFTAHGVSKTVLRDYEANISGNFFDSWYAGPWGVAAGYEYKENDGYHQPDALVSAGNTVGNVTQPTTGRKNANAQYIELNVPLASNLPMAKSLSVDVANRWSQFKWSGVVGTNTTGDRAATSTGKLGIKWQPVEQLLFRFNWSQGFRVPSLSELFLGQSDSYPGVNDPCVSHPNYQNCPSNAVQPNSQIHSTVGGNPDLQPEQATDRSVGFVYSPEWAPGLNFSADYYKIEITHIVSTLGFQNILNSCYAPPGQPSKYCNLITRTGPTITNILNTNQNLGSQHTNGWDVSLNYRFPTTPVGDFTLGLDMAFTKMDIFCSPSGEAISCTDTAGQPGTSGGFGGTPRHRYNLSLNWNYGPWDAYWKMYLIGRMYENCVNSPLNGVMSSTGWCSNVITHQGNLVTKGTNTLGTTVYNDVQASYTMDSWNTTFTFGIQNLFDKQPPIARDAFANSFYGTYGYRIPGRFFYGRIQVRF